MVKGIDTLCLSLQNHYSLSLLQLYTIYLIYERRLNFFAERPKSGHFVDRTLRRIYIYLKILTIYHPRTPFLILTTETG